MPRCDFAAVRLRQFHDAFRPVQHPVRHRYRAGVSPAGARRGLSAQQLARARTHHAVPEIARSRPGRTDRNRHRLDPLRAREPGEADRRFARSLLDLPVQVRHGVDQPADADRAQAGQCVPRRAARRRRALPLLRDRHQAADHRAGARGRRDLPGAPVAQVPPSPRSAAPPARAGEARQQAGDRRRRLQYVLGRPRDLPVHGSLGAEEREPPRACPPIPAAIRARSSISCCIRTASRSRSSTCPTCAFPIIGR